MSLAPVRVVDNALGHGFTQKNDGITS